MVFLNRFPFGSLHFFSEMKEMVSANFSALLSSNRPNLKTFLVSKFLIPRSVAKKCSGVNLKTRAERSWL